MAQCTCPAGTIGNPQTGCSKTPVRCVGSSRCRSGSTCEAGYCTASCSKDNDCSCGEACVGGRCRMNCLTDNQCPQGQLCKGTSCAIGCRSSGDCKAEEACVNGQCKDPCSMGTCGLNAECRVSDHRAVCLCPSGYRGKPNEECLRNECDVDSNCDMEKSCKSNKCVNPCLEPGACGINAMCRSVQHKAKCSCPSGYYGNALVECKQGILLPSLTPLGDSYYKN